MIRFEPSLCRIARLAQSLRSEHGSVIIETGLSFTILLVMVFGIMECSMMAYTYSVIEDAAKEGVRYAAVHGTNSSSCNGPSTGCDATGANIVSDVTNYARTLSTACNTLVVTPTWPDGKSTGTSRVVVSISCSYHSIFHFTGGTYALTVKSAGRILY